MQTLCLNAPDSAKVGKARGAKMERITPLHRYGPKWTKLDRRETRMSFVKSYFAASCLIFATLDECSALTGDELQGHCQIALNDSIETQTEAFEAGVCAGFIRGLLFFGPALGEQLRFCPPDNVTPMVGMQVLLKFFDAHPEMSDRPAEPLSVTAFRAAWPCQ